MKGFDVFFICVQDPRLFNGQPLRGPGYECISLNAEKVQVCTYVSLKVLLDISFVVVPRDQDILYLRIFAKEGGLLGNRRSLGIINIYHRPAKGGHTVTAETLFTETNEPTLVVGDLNIHNAYTDPMSDLEPGERRKGEHYMRLAALREDTIINTPGIYTRFPDNPTLHRPSVIDYTLANNSVLAKLSKWKDVYQRSGSDHIIIVTELDSEGMAPPRASPDWEKIKWRDEEGEPNPVIESALQRYLTEGNEYKEIYEAEGAEERFGDNLERLIQMVKNWAPQKNPTRWSKAWWTADITELRRVYTSAAQRVRRDGSGVEERNEAKKAYKSAIDNLMAKRKHWNNFLASAMKNDVWTAHQFTKQRQSVRIPGGHNNSPDQTSQKIMEHFFPPSDDPISPRPLLRKELVNSDGVTAGQVSDTLEKWSNKSAQGSDQVLYGIWKNIHRMQGKIIPKLAEDMLEWGIHPPMLKESTGIMLPKPGKKDYTDCASFRVMALMQTFSKIVERIVNKRLMAIAYKEDMYCINQTGNLPQRSTIDAALSLKHWIRESQFAGKKTSTVFLNVKGGFDNVNHSKLLDLLGTDEKVPRYLVDWISNFIHTRQIALAYPGSPRTSNKVDRGIPHGSPLSPRVFVIYVRALHTEIEHSDIFTSSYVDDFQITVASTSWYRNTKILEERIQRLNSTVAGLGLSFSIAKTELMHWRKPKEKGER